DREALWNKHPPLKLNYAGCVMVVASRSCQHEPGIASDRRPQPQDAFADGRLPVPDDRVLRIACNPEMDAVVELFRKFVRHSRRHHRGGLSRTYLRCLSAAGGE